MTARRVLVTGILASMFATLGCGDGTPEPVVTVANTGESSDVATDSFAPPPAPRPAPAPAPAPSVAKCELHIQLPSAIKSNEHIQAKVHIKNLGDSEITLVTPGDGSNFRRRTPIVGWSVLSAKSKQQHPKVPTPHGISFCGNINGLKPDEVFTLKPGDTKELIDWVGFPRGFQPDKYRVVFYYSNEPDLKWSGIPLAAHDASAMRAVKNSTPVALVSDEVEIEVTE